MSLPLGLWLYRLGSALVEPLAPRLLSARARRGKEDPDRLNERLGYPTRLRPSGPLIWLHGASVGESLSHLPLIERLRGERPDLNILVTSGTRTAADLLAQRLPPEVIHQYAPIDAPKAGRRFLDHWQPSMAVFVESELWPNLILQAKDRGIRLALLSARMTQSSADGWRKAAASIKALLGRFDLIQAQDAASQQRISALGGKVQAIANLKTLAPALDFDAPSLEALRAVIGSRPVVLAASTHEGEDEIILRAYQALAEPRPLLIIAPRHPERGPAVAQLARDQGLSVARRAADEVILPESQVYVADTLGEMGLFYRLADVAVICGSFLPGIGGHNPLEAARLGVAMICGNQVFNFAEVCADMEAARGLVLTATESEFMSALDRLLRDPAEAKALGDAAARHAARQGADMDRIWQGLEPLLPRPEATA